MNSIRNVMSRVFYRDQHADPGDLLLGLPLETGDKRIYPVYTRHGHVNGSHNVRDPQQIGYIEIAGNRATFVSIERYYGPIIKVAGLSFLGLVLLWLVQRFRDQGTPGVPAFIERGSHRGVRGR